METLDAIFTRRSVRRFSDQPVSPETVDTLLKAAMSAPSARNTQPWHFMVIDKRELLDQIAAIHPYAKMCLQAQLAIIPCTDLNLDKAAEGYWVEDISAAVQNILLAVRDQGMGAVWLGVYPNEERISEIRKLFALPYNIVPFNIIPIGYTDMSQEKVDRYKAERVHHNEW